MVQYNAQLLAGQPSGKPQFGPRRPGCLWRKATRDLEDDRALGHERRDLGSSAEFLRPRIPPASAFRPGNASAFSEARPCEQGGAEQKIGARVRKSRQKEAAGAAGAGLMQIECSEGEVLKLGGVGTGVEE
jgi:hypothetical protein